MTFSDQWSFYRSLILLAVFNHPRLRLLHFHHGKLIARVSSSISVLRRGFPRACLIFQNVQYCNQCSHKFLLHIKRTARCFMERLFIEEKSKKRKVDLFISIDIPKLVRMVRCISGSSFLDEHTYYNLESFVQLWFQVAHISRSSRINRASFGLQGTICIPALRSGRNDWEPSHSHNECECIAVETEKDFRRQQKLLRDDVTEIEEILSLNNECLQQKLGKLNGLCFQDEKRNLQSGSGKSASVMHLSQSLV